MGVRGLFGEKTITRLEVGVGKLPADRQSAAHAYRRKGLNVNRLEGNGNAASARAHAIRRMKGRRSTTMGIGAVPPGGGVGGVTRKGRQGNRSITKNSEKGGMQNSRNPAKKI